MRGWRANNNFLDRGISIESNVLDPGQKRIFARKSQLFGDRMSGGRGRGEVENVNDTPTLLLFVSVCLSSGLNCSCQVYLICYAHDSMTTFALSMGLYRQQNSILYTLTSTLLNRISNRLSICSVTPITRCHCRFSSFGRGEGGCRGIHNEFYQ